MTTEEGRRPSDDRPGEAPPAPAPRPEAPSPGPPTAPPSPPGYAPPTATSTGPPPAPAGSYRIKRSVLRVVGFTVLSFGLYHFYWFYVTRQEVSRELGTDDDAALQTAGLLVPVLNWVVTYWLWRDINFARTRVGLGEFSIPLYLVLSIFGLAPIFYCLVASHLNEYWDRRSGGQATDAPVTRNEKLVVALGALLWLLWILFVVVIIVIAVASS